MKPIILLLTLVLSAPVLAQPASTDKPVNVAILLYPGVELLDFAGPLEVFSIMKNSRVFTIAAKSGLLNTMKNSLTITPDYTLADCPQPDILVVPGASGEHVRAVTADTSVINWIQRTTSRRQLTMSVCTGAFVLGKAGLFDHKTVTTHWASTQMLQQMIPNVKVMEHTRFVEDGNLLTTAGVSAGIDGALRIVSKLRGPQEARSVAEIMEYDYWNPESGVILGHKLVTYTKQQKPTLKQTAPKPVTRQAKPASKSAPLAAEGIDPVCRMTLPKGTEQTVMFGSKQYGFCSGICKARFERDPAKYVTK